MYLVLESERICGMSDFISSESSILSLSVLILSCRHFPMEEQEGIRRSVGCCNCFMGLIRVT